MADGFVLLEILSINIITIASSHGFVMTNLTFYHFFKYLKKKTTWLPYPPDIVP